VASSSTRLESALVLIGFAVLFVLLPHELAGDDTKRFTDIERLLRDGELSDSRYSLVMPLVSVPVLLLGEVLRSPEWWAAHFNVIVVALGAIAVFVLLRGRVEGSVLRRALLVLLFASYLTNRLRDYNAEVLTATLFAVGIVLLAIRGRAVAGWTAIVIGVVNTPAAIAGAALAAVAESIRTRRLRHLLVPFVAAALIMGEAWIRRGGPLTTGYEGDRGMPTVLPYSGEPGFSYPIVLGLLSILFSLGRGLVFFTPGLLLWLSARTRRLLKQYGYPVGLMLLVVSGLVLVYAKWWAWYGGVAWGPRFFVFAAVPASVLLAVRLAHARDLRLGNALTLLVLTLSAWVGLSGAIADLSTLEFCIRDDAALESLCWYTPEFSPLWQPLVDFPDVAGRSAVLAAYTVLVFAYLAASPAAALARSIGDLPWRAWATGWRV
jgi:hypothetical protein